MQAIKKSRSRKAIAVVTAVIALAVIVPSTALASYTTQPVGLYSRPAPFALNGMATLSYWSIAMYCWTDSAWVYGSNRWFVVYGTGWAGSNVGWIVGWIPANYVKAQTVVRHC